MASKPPLKGRKLAGKETVHAEQLMLIPDNRETPKAITAMAHKLARLVYRMLKYGQEYVDKGIEYYEDRYRSQQVELLKKKAAKFGLQIVEIQSVGV